MVKTTLCDSCQFGLIREIDTDEGLPRSFSNKCMMADDYPGVITSCNHYEKSTRKTTYHNPDFAEYEKNVTDKKARVSGE